MNPFKYTARKLRALAEWTNRAPWGEYFANAFYVLFGLIFIFTIIGNAISGGFENSPWP